MSTDAKLGVPQNGWFIRENPTKMGDLGVSLVGQHHVFTHLDTHVSIHLRLGLMEMMSFNTWIPIYMHLNLFCTCTHV